LQLVDVAVVAASAAVTVAVAVAIMLYIQPAGTLASLTYDKSKTMCNISPFAIRRSSIGVCVMGEN